MKRTMLVVSLIFSLLFINAKEYDCEINKGAFTRVEHFIMEQYSFCENGIKLEYYTKNEVDEEKERIIDLLGSKIQVYVDGDCIICEGDNIKYCISIFTISKNTKVEIEMINTNYSRNIESLVKEAEEIKNNDCTNSRVFKYLKVKNDIDQHISDDAKENIKLDTIRSLQINNGSISTAELKDGERLNIAEVNYDTGVYLIIGTPTIFVTY